MNSALYWLLHLIKTLLALASKLWWVPRCNKCVCGVCCVIQVFVCCVMTWTSEYCKALAIEHHEGLLGKTMHNALYWELHSIGESHTYRLLFVGISKFWWVPWHIRLSWQGLNRWVGQLNLGFNDLLPASQAWWSGLQQTFWIWATFGLKSKDWHFFFFC